MTNELGNKTCLFLSREFIYDFKLLKWLYEERYYFETIETVLFKFWYNSFKNIYFVANFKFVFSELSESEHAKECPSLAGLSWGELGRTSSWRIPILSKKNKHFLCHKLNKKKRQFSRCCVVWKTYMTVRRSSQQRVRSALFLVTHNKWWTIRNRFSINSLI